MGGETSAAASEGAANAAGSGAGAGAIGVGMLGRGFMGRAHSIALNKLAWAAPQVPVRLVALCARDRAATTRMARELGYERAVFDWRELVEDPAIGLISNGGPNALHAAPTIAAAQAGKHVLCEKPLGRDAQEAHAIWSAVERAGVVHMAGFNYRFFPAVELARQVIGEGALGEIRHFRARYLQSWLVDPQAPASWRLDAQQAGAGALGDLGSHVVDLARHLVGEPAAVTARLATFVGERPGGAVDVDDAFAATVAFANGAIGTLEASRVAPGRKNQLVVEVNGTRGSLVFDQERKDELQLMTTGDARSDGFRRIAVTEPAHPFLRTSWPAGHAIGWEDSFVFEFAHLLGAIAGDHAVAPLGASCEDGYRCAEVCDAIARAARTRTEQQIAYRTLDEENVQ